MISGVPTFLHDPYSMLARLRMSGPGYNSLLWIFHKTKQTRYFDFLDPLMKANKNDLSKEALFLFRHFPNAVSKELAIEVVSARQQQ